MGTKKGRLGVWKRFAKKGVFPYQLAFTLLIPLRNIFLSPKKLVQRLELKENDHVLEIGPGPGYFSLEVAGVIPRGMLVLADIQQEMLDLSRRRLARKKVGNVQYHLCNGFDFPFKNSRFDVVFMVTVLGEIENQSQYLRECFRLLRPHGLLSISEQAGDADRVSTGAIKDLLHQAGFVLETFYGTKRNFTMNFRKGTLEGIDPPVKVVNKNIAAGLSP